MRNTKPKKYSQHSTYEDKLMDQIAEAQCLPLPARQYLIVMGRKWRADFAWIDEHLIVEVEGGVYTGGRHVTGAGFEKDCEKYNTACLLGWTVLRFTPGMIRKGIALDMIKRHFQAS